MALHDNACWVELNGHGRAADADECRMMRERYVAGKSNRIPPCSKHDKELDSR